MDVITINIVDIDDEKYIIKTPIDLNLNLMDVLKNEGFHMGNCGGMALCASCHCYIQSDVVLNDKTDEEEDMLDQLHNSEIDKSRLICQIPLTPSIDGITLKIVRN